MTIKTTLLYFYISIISKFIWIEITFIRFRKFCCLGINKTTPKTTCDCFFIKRRLIVRLFLYNKSVFTFINILS